MSTTKKPVQRGRPVNEQARQERMTQILDGARACFIARGFHASSTAEISAAAGVSVANIYQYYPNKEALIIALIEADLKRHHDMIVRFWANDLSVTAVKATLSDLFLTKEGHDLAVLRAEIASEGARNPDVAAMLRRSEAGLIQVLQRSILAARDEGRVPLHIDPIAVGERLSLAFEGIMRLYVFSPSDGAILLDRYYSQVADSLHLKA
ncbi:TetR/AcrR family transcriptional regulator [Azospirillum sp. B21]|uniref:TetR/AcrR family transcriptional regulator n=1 Tax=Azospirillum sp. B21 TaxID=2607496 RepID=UPI0011EBB7BB|nr:TetR/AcrR family transcriptional regulator [Azospirillum sp. B21]KAA0575172.1 TetR/AcrR family transcriptional regulator [Azospirillum sp. B21]